jgi:hypothetical protein
MSQREAFVQQAAQQAMPFAALCRHYKVSRKTGYKWKARYEQAGTAGLSDRSRRPHASPTRTPAAREAHPSWGGRKLKAWLQQQGCTPLPAESTMGTRYAP